MRLFKRWFVWFQIYALDIHIHDMKAMLGSIAVAPPCTSSS